MDRATGDDTRHGDVILGGDALPAGKSCIERDGEASLAG